MISKAELFNWKLKALYLLANIELHDAKFRQKVCSNCSPDMRLKLKCEEEIPNRTFCEKIVKSREKDRTLQQMELKIALESPFVKQSHSLRKIAENFYSLDE